MDADDLPSTSGSSSARSAVSTLVWLVGILLTVALLWLLHVGSTVFLPLAVATFLALAVSPLQTAVARRVPHQIAWLGYVAAAGTVIAFLLLFFAGIAVAAHQVALSASEVLPQLQQRLARLPFIGAVSDSLPQLLDEARGYATALAAGLGSTLGTLVIIFFLMLLMLLEGGDWEKKIDAISSLVSFFSIASARLISATLRGPVSSVAATTSVGVLAE